MKRLKWRRNTESPRHRHCALIIVNGLILLDVYVYNGKKDCFCTPTFYVQDTVELKIKRSEVQAWLACGDIPKPAWVPKRG